jgi:hypothetical protein
MAITVNDVVRLVVGQCVALALSHFAMGPS